MEGGALAGSRAHVISPLYAANLGKERGAWEKVKRVRGEIVRERVL